MRKWATALMTACALVLGFAGTASASVGANGNFINSIASTGKLVSGGIGAHATATIVCDPNDGYYDYQNQFQYVHPTLYLTVAQTINGAVYYGYNYRDGSQGKWTCTSAPQTLGITAWQQNSQPAFHTGSAVAYFELTGYDANGNWFDWKMHKTIKLK